MRHALRALISLYPKMWRNRYENEYSALLEDVPPTWRTLFDVFRGAMKMQLKSWNALTIVSACAIIGLLAAAAYSLTIPDQYRSTAIIKVEKAPGQVERLLSRGSLVQFIVEENLYQRERTHIPIEDIIENMKTNIVFEPVGKGEMALSFTTSDAEQARRTTGRLAFALNDSKTWSLVQPPNLPAHPVGPRRSRVLVMGLVLGLIAGGLFAFFNGFRIWKLATALGLAGMVTFVAASYLLTDDYCSTGVIRYEAPDPASGEAHVRQAISAVMTGANLEKIARLYGIYSNDPHAARTLSEHLHIELLPNTTAVHVTFDYGDRYMAQKVTQKIVYQLMDESAKTPSGTMVEMIDPPSLPFNPVSPNRATISVIGLLLGFTVAMLVAIRERRRTPVLGA